MSGKSTEKNTLQYLGIGLFVFALAVFIGSLTLSHYELSLTAVKDSLGNDYHYGFVEQSAQQMAGKSYPNSFAFLDAFEKVLSDAQTAIKTDVEEVKGLTKSDGAYWNSLLQDWQLSGLIFPVTKAEEPQ